MKQNFNQFIYLLGVCILLFSCDSKTEDTSSPFMIVDKKDLVQSFTSDTQSKKVSVFANQNVRARLSFDETEEKGWCEVDIIPATLNEFLLEISVSENEVKSKRQARVTLTVDNYKETVIDVVQSGIILPLKLTDFEPKEGGKADVITFTGENFGDMAANIQVFFNNTAADIISVKETEMTVAVPQLNSETDYQIRVERFEMKETYSESFTYEKRWWIENVIVDVLPSAIAVDNESNYILYLRRFEDGRLGGELGIYRVDLKTNQHTFLTGYGFVPGSYGYTGITYDKVSKKFYVVCEIGGTSMHILSIDPHNNWSIKDHAVAAGVNGYWAPGLTVDASGKLYSRQWNGNIIKIDTQSWTSTILTSLVPHGRKDQSPALAVANGTNNLYVQIRESSELAYVDITNGDVTWLNTSTETGLYDGTIAEARFLRGEQMCSDKEGHIYLVDQDNHAVRMITSDKVETIMGGNGAGAQNGMGLNASFNAPSGISIDDNGTLYIGDTWNASIRKATRQ